MRRYGRYKEAQLQYLEGIYKVIGIEFKRDVLGTKDRNELNVLINEAARLMRAKGYHMIFRIQK